jgi:hypothetical protein
MKVSKKEQLKRIKQTLRYAAKSGKGIFFRKDPNYKPVFLLEERDKSLICNEAFLYQTERE